MLDAIDPVKPGKIVIIMLALWMALELLDASSALFAISVLGGFGGDIADAPQLALADTLSSWIGVTTLIVYLLTAIALLRWIYVTSRNAHRFSDQLDITPGMAVMWFFVPFLNLYKPFHGVSETWRATISPHAMADADVPVILRWWWGLWLTTALWGNATFRVSQHAETADALVTANWMLVAGLLIDIPLVLVLTRIIRRLSAMQGQRLATLPVCIHADDDSI